MRQRKGNICDCWGLTHLWASGPITKVTSFIVSLSNNIPSIGINDQKFVLLISVSFIELRGPHTFQWTEVLMTERKLLAKCN